MGEDGLWVKWVKMDRRMNVDLCGCDKEERSVCG